MERIFNENFIKENDSSDESTQENNPLESEKVIPSVASEKKLEEEELKNIKDTIQEKKKIYENWKKLDTEINLFLTLGDIERAEERFILLKTSPYFSFSEARTGGAIENTFQEAKGVFMSQGEAGLIEWMKLKKMIISKIFNDAVDSFDKNEESRENLKLDEKTYYENKEQTPLENPSLN